MPYDRFFIAPFDKNSGLQNDVKPFLIPDEAFARCNNAYQWRGRVRKRFGSRWLGATQNLTRLKISVGSTSGGGNLSGTVPGVIFKLGQAFSIGDAWYTVVTAGAVQPMLQTVVTPTATFSTTNGAFNFVGAPASTTVYFYPSEPVMGLDTYIEGIQNDATTVAFDTQFAYSYESTGWERIAGEADVGAATWTGNNSQLFWATTYGAQNANDYTLYVTNFNQIEPNYMRFLFNDQWNNFAPILTDTPVSAVKLVLVSAAILLPFKNRLVAFNVWEQDQTGMAPFPAPLNYPFRIRWSQIGDPTDVVSWREDITGKGGVIDISDIENIITVEFVKDRCIIYCEESTWELVDYGNQVQPFTVQKINTELGAESRFSVVPFDKVALGWGDTGLHACNGTNVERIDDNIPDEVFNLHTEAQGIDRVYGIRDYTTEMVYWTYPTPSRSNDQPFPNRILVYNYKTGTWAFNDDCITAFGYIQQPTIADWSSQTIKWNDAEPWSNNQLQPIFRRVIAGNQEGFTFIVDSDVPLNSSNLQITNITSFGTPNLFRFYVADHNLSSAEYIYFSGIIATGNLNLFNNKIFRIQSILNANEFLVLYFDDAHTILSGTYNGNGNIATISQIDILTKQFNFYFKDGRNLYVPKVDFLVDTSFAGELTIDYFVSTSGISMVGSSLPNTGTNSIVGTSVLETFPYDSVPFEQFSTQVWHPVYFQADGEFIQLRFYNTPNQLQDPNIQFSDFQLNAMTFYATPTSYRNQ